MRCFGSMRRITETAILFLCRCRTTPRTCKPRTQHLPANYRPASCPRHQGLRLREARSKRQTHQDARARPCGLLHLRPARPATCSANTAILGDKLPAFEDLAKYIFYTETSQEFDAKAMNIEDRPDRRAPRHGLLPALHARRQRRTAALDLDWLKEVAKKEAVPQARRLLRKALGCTATTWRSGRSKPSERCGPCWCRSISSDDPATR